MKVELSNNKDFWAGLLLIAVGAGAVRDIRQGPRSGGTSFVLLHYLLGAPVGGVRARPWWESAPDAFTTAVTDLARKRGVVVRTGAPVSRIVVRDDAVSGVVLVGGEEISASTVISTADPSSSPRAAPGSSWPTRTPGA